MTTNLDDLDRTAAVRRPRSLSARVRYGVAASRAIVADPAEGLDRIVEKFAERRDRRSAVRYRADQHWERTLHEILRVPWPCHARFEFDELWTDVLHSLTERGLRVGKGAFGGWDDADPAFGRATWCLTRHLKPRHAVETGVGRGITTRLVLAGLERDRTGRLWSIDLPPLIEQELHTQTGAAVSLELRDRWTLIRGSSRRRLPALLAQLGQVDLFIHDSMHTERNLRFELDRAWQALRAGGALLADDVNRNPGLKSFAQEFGVSDVIICQHDDGKAQFAIMRKPVEQ